MKSPRAFWFSLKSLLFLVVLVAGACAFLAHEKEIVRVRRAWLNENPAALYTATVLQLHGHAPDFAGNVGRSPSWIRRLLGDQSQSALVIKRTDTPTVAALFPEAAFFIWDH